MRNNDNKNNTSLFDKSVLEMDRIKQRGGRVETNLYFDSQQIQEMLLLEQCLLYVYAEALFLLVPKHENFYYECYYFTSHISSLTDAFTALKQDYKENKKIRITIVGKDERTAPICEAFYNAGCVFHRKLIRRRSLGQTKKQLDKYKHILSGEEKQNISFAKKSDIDEIYSMLIKEFDYFGDNIPDKKELLLLIKNKNILILRKGNVIVALHIFSIANNIWSSIFDLTKKKYRLDMLQAHIQIHLNKYLKRKGVKPTRSYEWRDIKKTKLVNNSKVLANFHETDVLYINFLLYPAIENNRIIAK